MQQGDPKCPPDTHFHTDPLPRCFIHGASHTLTPHRYVVTCDKDHKVRVSILPEEDPTLGSVEIQSYCLGHTYFVSSCVWVAAAGPGGGSPLLVTGGRCRRGVMTYLSALGAITAGGFYGPSLPCQWPCSSLCEPGGTHPTV